MTAQSIETRREKDRIRAATRRLSQGASPDPGRSKLLKMERMREVEQQYARTNATPRNERCCGKCRTPFGVCAKQRGCSCHQN